MRAMTRLVSGISSGEYCGRDDKRFPAFVVVSSLRANAKARTTADPSTRPGAAGLARARIVHAIYFAQDGMRFFLLCMTEFGLGSCSPASRSGSDFISCAKNPPGTELRASKKQIRAIKLE